MADSSAIYINTQECVRKKVIPKQLRGDLRFNELARENRHSPTNIIIRCGTRRYFVHKIVVCSQSAFFRKCFEGEFKEATSREVELKEKDFKLVRAALQYLYCNRFRTTALSNSDVVYRLTFAIQLYALADELMIPALKNYIANRRLNRAYRKISAQYRRCKVNLDDHLTDLFNALKFTAQYYPPDGTTIREKLLYYVTLNDDLLAESEAFQTFFNDACEDDPEFAKDLYMLKALNATSYLKVSARRYCCPTCSDSSKDENIKRRSEIYVVSEQPISTVCPVCSTTMARSWNSARMIPYYGLKGVMDSRDCPGADYVRSDSDRGKDSEPPSEDELDMYLLHESDDIDHQ